MSDPIETVEFDVENGRFRAEYDPEETAPSVAVVDVVGRVREGERAPDSLYEVVDPDALDSLLESGPNGDYRDPVSVSFPYAGLRVTVTSDGRITVRPTAEGRAEVDGDR